VELSENAQFAISLTLQPIKLPPVTDILVLAKKYPQGKMGVMEAFKFIAPDEFEMIDVDDEDSIVEAVLINKRILKRLSSDKVLSVLKKYAFPYISQGEAVNVDFSVKLSFDNITGDANQE